ncbi:MAG: MarR family transcriptional regulator [Lapillicoccus sp.]
MTSTEPRWLTTGEQDAWRAYLRGSRMLEEALDRDLQTHGLQLSEYEIISMLSETPRHRLRMSELADLVVQSRSRLTHTATRLEKRGWVTREPCENDRRGVELVLTPQGRDRVMRVSAAHVESVRTHLIDPMSPEEFEGLGTAMAKVRDAQPRSDRCSGADATLGMATPA